MKQHSNLNLNTEIDIIFPTQKPWKYNDGGRSKTKWRGTADCGVRALSIVTNMPYEKSRRYLKAFGNIGKANNRRISTGVYQKDMNLVMESLGWFYQKGPKFFNRKTYWTDLPNNITALCNMPGHFVAIKNGILLDTFDSSNRYIIGYWTEIV